MFFTPAPYLIRLFSLVFCWSFNLVNISCPSKISQILVVSFCLVFAACSSNESEIDFEEFVKSFDQVKTDHAINSGLSEQFIWTDEYNFLSFAVVTDGAGDRRIGLYSISLHGDKKLLVEGVVSEYCVLGKTIFVQGYKGNSKDIGKMPGYEIVLVSEEKNQSGDRGQYSPVRCGFFNPPEKPSSIFRTLKGEDGFLEISVEDEVTWNSLKPQNRPSLANQPSMTKQSFLRQKIVSLYRQSSSAPIWDLYIYEPVSKSRQRIAGRWPAPPSLEFNEYSNSYFGYSNKNGAVLFWSLDRSDWTIAYEQFIYPEHFVNRGSRVIEPTKVGYVLEHHNSKNGGLYLVSKGEVLPLKKGVFRYASVSPNGCLLAYAEGDISRFKRDKLDFTQTLKVADICSYSNAREGLYDNH